MKICYQAILFGLLVSLFIILFIDSLYFMQAKLFNISYWRLSHIFIYFIMALLCPNNLTLFMILGVLWEITERLVGFITAKEKFWTSGGSYGQAMDILMNFIGYKLGEFVHPYLFTHCC